MPPRFSSKSLIKLINNSALILVSGEQLDISFQIQGTVLSALILLLKQHLEDILIRVIEDLN